VEPPLNLTGVILYATTRLILRIQFIDSMLGEILSRLLRGVLSKQTGMHHQKDCRRLQQNGTVLLLVLTVDLLRCRAGILFRVGCAIRRDGMAHGFGSNYRALVANTRTRSLGR
jgi:hypothetical protein